MAEKISVIMTVLNESGSIQGILSGLLSQTRKPDEIVIVDGGSTDGTIGIIEDMARKDSAVRLIVENGVNISKGRNTAIRHAVYPLVAVIDGGCRPEKNWLESMVTPFEADPSVDAVKGIYRSDPRTQFEYFSGLLHWAGGLVELDDDKYPMSGRCSAFRKEIWERAGGYPEWLYTAEDTLYHEKLKSLQAKIALARRAVVYWRPRKDLRRLAKMYFLYGRGQGHIGSAQGGAWYHLRNYGVLLALTLISPFYFPVLPLFLVFLVYLFAIYYWPDIKKVKKVYSGWKAYWYVPLIVSARTVAHSIGLLVGNHEFRKDARLRENLERYWQGAGS
jgi:succinoglycan biosynthesis protein ExoA